MQYEQLAPLQADEAVFACGIGTRLGKSHRLLGIPNEDTYTYVTNFFPGDDYFPTLENSSSSPIRSWTFAGVWDGHGGTGASSYCARSMHETLAAILAREYAKAEEDGEAEPGIQVCVSPGTLLRVIRS
jgi:serine/threonine protein phosphatase PrpC